MQKALMPSSYTYALRLFSVIKMKPHSYTFIITVLWLILCNPAFSQTKNKVGVSKKKEGQIEIMPYIRWDTYPKFTYAINSITTNEVSLKGSSFGINTAWGKEISRNFKLKAGIGYYRYSFNNIKKLNSSFGEGNQRTIEYRQAGDVIYGTNKYWYHTIALSIGIEKHYTLKENISFFYGLSAQYFQTFSQFYKIANAYDFKRSHNRGFGFSGSLQLGIAHHFNRIAIAPQIIIPLYDRWRKDAVFPSSSPGIQENPSEWRSKWLGGWGMGCAIQYKLKK